MSKIVYFSKMFQAVPHLAQVQNQLPGMFVSSRRSTLQATARLYPEMSRAYYSRFLGDLASGNRHVKSAQALVTGSPGKGFFQKFNAKTCMVFHGTFMLLSKQTLSENSHHDLLCVIGPRMQQMIERFSSAIRLKQVVKTGFLPFCEFPDIDASSKEKTLLSLGLNPQKKTILYAPSRRGVGSWDFAAEKLLETAPYHYNLILRPHPSQALTSRAADRKSFRRVRKMARYRPDSLLDLTCQPLPLLLSIADLIVSDANSPAEESLFYNAPQLFIETPQLSLDTMQKQAEKEGMHPDDTEQLLSLYDCGPRHYTADTLNFNTILDQAILASSDYDRQRERYFSWVFGKRDRKANERVAKAISTHLLKS